MRMPLVIALCTMPLVGVAQERRTQSDRPTAVRVAVAATDASIPATARTPLDSVPSTVTANARCEAAMDDKSLRELVQSEAKRIGLDEKLALVILAIESRNGVDLNSPKGARGPMQLMPATAAQYGVKDICNPVENVRGGIAYLKDLSAQFAGNPMLIAAAYNAGSERVYRANGVPPITETVRYVADTVNRYYGLNALATRRAKNSTRPVDDAPANPDPTPAKGDPSHRQEWIGGTVLYVSSDNEGDK